MPVIATTRPDPTFTNLGAGHFMRTHADLYDNGHLAAWTTTESVTWFGGFVGTVAVLAFGPNGNYLGVTTLQKYGVNGRAFGESKRTVTWFHGWDVAFAQRATGGTLLAVHGWKFEVRVLDELAVAAETIAKIALILGLGKPSSSQLVQSPK